MRPLSPSLVALLLAACTPLGAFNAIVPKDEAARRIASDLPFASGNRRSLDIYAPDDARSTLPVIVFFYGGSWNSGSKDGYGFVGRALAAQGFLVAIPDYRLVPEVRFPDFLEDGAAAVKWVRANAVRFGGDPNRIVLAGHSAGAYNAAMLALDPRWQGEARSSVRGFAGIAGPYDFLPLDTAVTRVTFGRASDLNATQPVRFASSGDPSALLIAGGRDDLVRGSNSVRLTMVLTRAGVPVETRVYDELGHIGLLTAFAQPFRGRGTVLRDVADFARRVTGTPAMRVPRSPSPR